MFVKKIKRKDKTHLYLVESYRLNNKIKHRTIKSLGILEELQKQYPEKNIIDDFNNIYKNKTETLSLSLDSASIERTEIKNYGYYILESIYEKLDISTFINYYQNTKSVKFELNKALKLLVFSRILNPDSKLQTLNSKGFYIEDFNLDLNNIYRSLDLIDEIKDELQFNIHKNIVKNYGRDCNLVFYDVTNYYFEVHENDIDKLNSDEIVIEGFRKKGMGKDGKRQPLVVMGLLMDENSIPVAYKLFKGNESDTKTMIPVLTNMSEKYNLNKIIFVADKGINSENNLNYLANKGHGYILSQKARGQTKALTEEILKEENYIHESSDFKYKSIVRTRLLKCKDDVEKNIQVNEKIVFFWSRNYFTRAQHKRKEEMEKIKFFIKNQKQLTKIEKELKPYIIEKVKDSLGNEIKDVEVEYEFDESKFKEACKLDGYYLIISNEIQLTEKEIIEKYRGLSEIENSFRILKTDFEGRPVYVRNKSRIEGHFLTCFLSLIIMRIFQNLTQNKYSIEVLSDAIKTATIKPIQKDLLLFNKTNETYAEIENIFNINNKFSYLKMEQLKEYKKQVFDYIKKASFR